MNNTKRSLFAAGTLFVMALLVASCASGTIPGEEPGDRAPAYFPPGLLGAEGNSAFATRWYSSFLAAMDEPSLWEMSRTGQGEAYRFLWLPTFDRPVVVRVLLSEGRQAEVVVKVLSGQGGYEPGHLVRDDVHPLSARESANIAEVIKTSSFWSLPVQAEDGLIGVDGEQWVVEGARSGHYHVVDRWSPETGPVRQIGEDFLRLAGLARRLSR